MNIFDKAIELEKQGEQLYRQIASEATDISVKIILKKLAEDEVKHRLLFEQMKLNLSTDVVRTNTKELALEVFKELSTKVGQSSITESLTQALNKAEDIEMKSYNYYMAEAEKVDNPKYKEVILKIAKEEELHASIVLDLINYYLEPKQWLENAEWNHHDEY